MEITPPGCPPRPEPQSHPLHAPGRLQGPAGGGPSRCRLPELAPQQGPAGPTRDDCGGLGSRGHALAATRGQSRPPRQRLTRSEGAPGGCPGPNEPRHCKASNGQASPDSCPPRASRSAKRSLRGRAQEDKHASVETSHLSIQSGHSKPSTGDQHLKEPRRRPAAHLEPCHRHWAEPWRRLPAGRAPAPARPPEKPCRPPRGRLRPARPPGPRPRPAPPTRRPRSPAPGCPR